MAAATSWVLSPRIVAAFNVAALAHAGQVRKGTQIPYISHLAGVMYVASRQGLAERWGKECEEDVLIACLFHDILEDVPEAYSAARMRQEFGSRVVGIVREVTKETILDSWEARSQAYLAHLRAASEQAVVVSACDKLHNLSSILSDYDAVGEGLWERFNSGKHRQQWWYRAVFEALASRLPDLPLLGEYRTKLQALEAL